MSSAGSPQAFYKSLPEISARSLSQALFGRVNPGQSAGIAIGDQVNADVNILNQHFFEWVDP